MKFLIFKWTYIISSKSTPQAAGEKRKSAVLDTEHIIDATDSKVTEGENGGFVTTNMIQVDVETDHVGAVFRCEANHNATGKSVHNAVRLNVKCK